MTALGVPLRTRVRRARGPLAVGALVLVAAVVLAVVAGRADRGLLLPTAADPQGSAALVAILREQGVDVTVATRPEEVVGLGPDTTLLVAFPDRLGTVGRLAAAHSGSDVVLVAPDAATLEDLAPGVRPTTPPPALLTTGAPPAPACPLRAATAAGAVDLAGDYYTVEPPAIGCYAADGVAPLAVSGRTVVVGDPAPFTNEVLAQAGNAALTTTLLGAHPRLVWYLPVPSPADGGQASLTDLLPDGVVWGTVQLLLAGVVTALWRGRRLGPLVAERLPVRVAAAETTRGRAGLYRRIGARGRAADVLRAATRRRLAARLGLPPAVGPDAVTTAVASAAGRDPADVADLLYGAAPGDDHALVALADRLDVLRADVGRTRGGDPS